MALVARRSPMRLLVQATLRPYSQIILSRDLLSGAFVLLAIFTFPRIAIATLLAVAIAQLLTLLLGFGVEAVREGGGACVAVLTTLATTSTLGHERIALVVIGAILAVLFTASFNAAFARLALPTHSLPFVAAAWVVALAARTIMVPSSVFARTEPLSILPASLFNPSWLDAPATILFLGGAAAGGLLLLAIAWHSRIALLLAAVGGVVATATHAYFRGDMPWSVIDLTASFNAMLAAMAIGGVWFVPQPASIALGAGAAFISCMLTYALAPVTALASLPVLSLPFVLTTQFVISAMRMRERDRSPSTALAADRPEDALSNHLMRVRRFGEFAWLPFRLPFRGTWIVTQGHAGTHTHKGPWRYAFDFEIAGVDGTKYTGEGKELADFRCYGLPVLAAGAGTVEHVIDGVAENAIGGMNAKENWGNAVVIAHGSNLYSVCAHLQPKSIRVKTGDKINAGAEIGRCGNSGRSLVPHLHFHVQRGPALGSETLPADFGDVVARSDDRATVSHRVIPLEGDQVRPVGRDETLAGALDFPAGSSWTFVDRASGQREEARVEFDLFGRRMLRSAKAQLFFEPYETGLVFAAFHGDRASLLRYPLLVMARIPFDQEATLSWRDRVPRRLMLPRGLALTDDLVSVVAPRLADFEITYTSQRTESAIVIVGATAGFTTRATISLDDKPHVLSVVRHGRDTVVELSENKADTDGVTAGAAA